MSETLAIGITGAAGYIGATVAARLLNRGHDIVAVDNFQNPHVEAIDGVTIKNVDIRDRPAVREVFASVDVVLHLAAISGVPDCEEQPETAFDVNVEGRRTWRGAVVNGRCRRCSRGAWPFWGIPLNARSPRITPATRLTCTGGRNK